MKEEMKKPSEKDIGECIRSMNQICEHSAALVEQITFYLCKTELPPEITSQVLNLGLLLKNDGFMEKYKNSNGFIKWAFTKQ